MESGDRMECRICGNKNLYKFLSLGKTPLANSFLKNEESGAVEDAFPLNTCFCDACGLVQLDKLVPPDMMFKNYIYFSSTSDLLQQHFSELAEEVSGMLKQNALVVEIASNDGIVLRNFQQMNMRVLGVEPAVNIAKHANDIGIETINEYWSFGLAERLAENEKADAILANNVIGHVHDLHDFAKGISHLLKDDGIVVIQVQYLVDLIEKLEYDTIYHEHVSYISLHPVVRLFEKYGLTVFNVKRFPDIHGGSIRFYLAKKRRPSDSVSRLLDYEKNNGFMSNEKYAEFAKRVEVHKGKMMSLLKHLKSQGNRVAGYGAAAKANTMLNYCGIGRDFIEYIADKSPHKQGLLTPGMKIPVVAPAKIIEDSPDYVVILAWNFADEIMRQLAPYRSKGGKFIIPIPEPKIIE